MKPSMDVAPLLAGLETFDSFFARTRADWARLAAYVVRRGPLPRGLSVEDVEQRLKLEAWRRLRRWEPGRGRMSPRSYMIWAAITKTNRWLSDQRRKHWRADVGVLEVGMVKLPDSSRFATQPDADVKYELKSALAKLRSRCETERHRVALGAFVREGSVSDAARMLERTGAERSVRGGRRCAPAAAEVKMVVDELATAAGLR